MVILPAIDIMGGACVRLVKGAFDTAHQVAGDPLETALSFRQAGARWLHTVDLDGARDAAMKNQQIIFSLAKKSGLNVEVGGGIRDMQAVESYLSRGVARVILGSAAVKNPAFVKEAVKQYGEKVAVGIDARDGKVAAEGWLDTSQVDYLELAKAMEAIGVKVIIFTDISKDGTLAGPNLSQLAALNEAVSCHIIASGGIRDISNIKDLCEMGLYGAICGKSLYSGTLSLEEAVALAQTNGGQNESES